MSGSIDMSVVSLIFTIGVFAILIASFWTMVKKDQLIRTFYKLGKKYPYKKGRINSKKYVFTARDPEMDFFIYGYSGGVISATQEGFLIKHPLMFRVFLKTALIPWKDIQIEKRGAFSFSIILEIADQYRIKFCCRPRAIREIMDFIDKDGQKV